MSARHGGDVWRAGAPGDWLDFSANLNPDGTPEWARRALAGALGDVGYYPDPRLAAARRGLAAHLRLPEDCVLPTAGGMAAIALAARALDGPAAVAEPAFGEYARCARGPVRSIDRWDLPAANLPAGGALWLCNPCNPSGEAFAARQVAGILRRAEEAGAALVVDEAFIHYCPDCTVAPLARSHPSLVVLGSLTKVLAAPGARLGYLAAHPSLVERLARQQEPWPLNCFAASLAAALPGREAFFAQAAQDNARRRAQLAAGLRALGARVFPSRASFLLAELPVCAGPLAESLRERGILVRECAEFRGLGSRHVRLAVKREAENARLLRALEELL